MNPRAARERIAYEKLISRENKTPMQPLLMPQILKLSPPEFTRVITFIEPIRTMGFVIEEFGKDTIKVDAVPQIIGNLPVKDLIQTIAGDLNVGSSKRSGERWREELIAKSVAKSYAGTSAPPDEKSARELIDELMRCRMPYVSPRGKCILFLLSNNEIKRKFDI